MIIMIILIILIILITLIILIILIILIWYLYFLILVTISKHQHHNQNNQRHSHRQVVQVLQARGLQAFEQKRGRADVTSSIQPLPVHVIIFILLQYGIEHRTVEFDGICNNYFVIISLFSVKYIRYCCLCCHPCMFHLISQGAWSKSKYIYYICIDSHCNTCFSRPGFSLQSFRLRKWNQRAEAMPAWTLMKCGAIVDFYMASICFLYGSL